MKRATGEYPYVTFIVRMWQEPRDSPVAGAVWRGTALHVQSGTERGVIDLDDLLRFMQTWMGTSDSQDKP